MNRSVFHQRLRLFRRQDDILIVRKDENIFRIDLLRRGGDIARRGIHGLSALDDAVHEQILENIRKPLPRADGKHSHLFLFRFPLRAQLTVLFQHILYLRSVQLAEFQSVGERHARRIRMHVHFDHFQIADTNDAVAEIHQPLAQSVYIRERRALF